MTIKTKLLFFQYLLLSFTASTSTLALNQYLPVPARINSYRWFIENGEIAHPKNTRLHGPEARNFVHQAYNWVNTLGEVTPQNLFDNLEKVSLHAKLLIKRRALLQHHNLIMGQNLEQAANECQTRFNQLIPIEGEQSRRIEKLKQHAHIWWAILSIKRTNQNFAGAWHHLEQVDAPPYTKVAKLWQAHLIVRNNHSPTGNRADDLLLAGQLLEQLAPAPQHVPGHQHLQEQLHIAQAQLQTGLQPQENQQIEIGPQAQPAPQEPNTVHPEFMSSANMQALRRELTLEIANEQAVAEDNPTDVVITDEDDDDDDHPNDMNGGISSSDSSDDDDDNDGSHPSSNGAVNNNNNNANTEGFGGDTDQAIRTSSLARFNELFPPSSHDNIDKLTAVFIESGAMPQALADYLDQSYDNVRPKKENSKADNQHDIRIVKLIFHYSMNRSNKSRHACYTSPKISPIFKHFFHDFKESRSIDKSFPKELRRRFLFRNTSTLSGFYGQILAYRDEIQNKNTTIEKIRIIAQVKNLCPMIASVRTLKSFLTSEEPIPQEVENKLLKDFRESGLKLFEDKSYNVATHKELLKVLWHGLKDDELPKRELGVIKNQKSAGVGYFMLNNDQKKFLINNFQNLGFTKSPSGLTALARQFYKEFKLAISSADIKRFYDRYHTTGSLNTNCDQEKGKLLGRAIREFIRKNERPPKFKEFKEFLKEQYGLGISSSTFYRHLKEINGFAPKKATGKKRSREQMDDQ